MKLDLGEPVDLTGGSLWRSLRRRLLDKLLVSLRGRPLDSLWDSLWDSLGDSLWHSLVEDRR